MNKLMAKIAGFFLKSKLKLKEGTAMDSKKWYQSKGVWTGVLTVVIGTYEGVRMTLAPQFGWTIPEIPPFVYTILGTLGIYSRVVANSKIS